MTSNQPGIAARSHDVVVFSQMFESLLQQALADRMTPDLKRKLKESVHVDLDGALMPAYPAEVWPQTLRLVAAELFPGEEPDEALRKLGHANARGFMNTLVGNALVALLKILGPHRTLERMTRNFRTGNNFMETRLTKVGAADYRIWVSEVQGMPTFLQGVFETALSIVGAKDLVVKIESTGGSECVYLISWKP